MENMNKIFVMFTLLVLLLCFAPMLCSCGGKKEEKHFSLKIVNWNAQTFFDAHNEGTEYSNFLKSKKWGIEAYTKRLKRLCDVIKKVDGDVIILEEIENDGIIYDISNQLAGDNWNPKKVYRYACFAKKENSSIGCAVLSRYELCGLKIHSLDICSENAKAPSMRPLMEVDLLVPKSKFSVDENPRCLKIFVNHWKSKAGGEEKSRVWRKWQERLLAEKIFEAEKSQKQCPIVCVGDFNQDISEFNSSEQYLIMQNEFLEKTENLANKPNIKFDSFFSNDKVFVYSPWFDFDGEEGSYYFRDNWERIDHFFSYGAVVLTEFAPQTSGDWAYEDGRPKAFKIYSLSGWSDHLPIACRVAF